MASSHRRHRQDKTVLSCLVLSCLGLSCRRRRCELNWRQVNTAGDWKFRNRFVQSRKAVWTHLWTRLDPVSKYDVTIGNHVACELKTGSGQDKTQFTPLFETGQTCFEIFSRRQCWLVANSVHTADADKTSQDKIRQDKTRQYSLVLSVSAVWTSH